MPAAAAQTTLPDSAKRDSVNAIIRARSVFKRKPGGSFAVERENAARTIGQTYEKFGGWTSKRGGRVRDVPGNFVKGVLGTGPALTAMVGAAARATPDLVRAANHDPEAMVRVGAGTVAIARQLASQAKASLKDPVGTAIKYPFELLPVANAGAKAVAGAVGKGAALAEAGAAARSAATANPTEATIFKGVADLSRGLRKPAEAVAEHGVVKAPAKALDEALRRWAPPYDDFRQQMKETGTPVSGGVLPKILNDARSTEQIARNKDLRQFWKHYGDLSEPEHQQFGSLAAGVSGPAPSDRVGLAVQAFRHLDAQTQHEFFKMGRDLGPLEKIPRYQPARIEEFGAAFPRVLRSRGGRATAEAGVTEEQINSFAQSVAKAGGGQGPIAGDRLRAIGRRLSAMKVDPAKVDPLDIAHEVWKSEAPRLAKAGKLKPEHARDFNAFLQAAKTGSYDRAAPAPLAHQIEGIVKGALGETRQMPDLALAGATRTPKPMEAIEHEVDRLLSGTRKRNEIDKMLREHVMPEDFPEWANLDPAKEAAFVEKLQAVMDGEAPLPEEVAARVIERDANLRRHLGFDVERRLQGRRAEVQQRWMPRLEKLPKGIRERRVYQLTREEFLNDPKALERGYASTGMLTSTPEEVYDAVIAQAIERRKVVPLEVLEQNDDWFDRALSGPNRRLMHATDEVAKAIAARQTTQPIYIPMMRRPLALNWRNLFKRPAPAERPGSPFKQRTGKTYASDEWVKDPRVLAARMTGQLRAHQRAQQIVDKTVAAIKSGQIRARVIRTKEELLPGEVAWNPDGIKMWRQHLDFGTRFLDEMQTFGASEEGAGRALAEAMKKSILDDEWSTTKQGYTKPTIYAIAKPTGEMLAQSFQEAPAWIRNILDAPTDLWRWAVLTARPAWLMNNIIGNTIFSTLNGVAPRHYLMALSEQFRAKTPDNLNGVHLTAQESDLGLVRHGGGPLGEMMEWLDSKPAPVGALDLGLGSRPLVDQMVLKIGDPRRLKAAVGRVNRAVKDLGTNVESFYRTANYMKEAEKLAGQRIVQRAGKSGLEAASVLDEMDSFSPADLDKIVAKVNYFMHDYAALTPFERGVVRRIIPFVNFQKHQIRLLLQLPLDYPGRASMLQAAVAVGKEMQAEDNAKLPEWARDRGYTDTNYTVEVDGRPLRAFVATGGWNPFLVGYGPASDAPETSPLIPEAIRLGIQSSGPVVRTFVQQAQGAYDYATRRPLRAPHMVERDGRWYDSRTGEEAAAPYVDPVSFYVSQFPQTQITRKLVNPRSGYPGAPLSFDTYREQATTTPAAQLLKYFTPASIILIDQNDVRRVYAPGRRERKSMRRAFRREEGLREMDRGAWWNTDEGRGDAQGRAMPGTAPADSAGRR